ncbi:IS1595 family transposase [Bauldia litoralis]|uniref:IS1595 family transposase n=1 Tax=Bauldia litoralis TaxID=665467 RepID=UPI003265C014
MTDLTNPIFHNDDKARGHLEALRWPDGVVCPHCGNTDPARIRQLKGKSHRPGLYQCNECREHFTVTVGSVMERSHVPLRKWVLAFHLMAASKKGMSAHQLHRMLGVTYKTAWFMAHRIREAMTAPDAGPIGGSGKVVEADETYIGKTSKPRFSKQRGERPYIKRKGPQSKNPVVALVERGGEVRMFHVENATKENVRDILVRNVRRDSELHTDESRLYTETGKEYAGHHTVKHSGGEYVRYERERIVHSNTVENVFSVFKRGMTGVYQHCSEAHLHRYLTEFEFRRNRRTAVGFNDAMRADDAIRGAEGKRLTYRPPN